MENNISLDEHIKRTPEKKVVARQTFSSYYRDFSQNKKAQIIAACLALLLIVITTIAFAVYARNKEDSAVVVKTKTTPTPRKTAKKTVSPSPKKTPTNVPSPTESPTPTSPPEPTPTNTPVPRTPNPPKFKITYPTENQVITMNKDQTFCVVDSPDGGDHAGVTKRHNINDEGWTEYKSPYTTCYDPKEGSNNIKLQYRNPHGDESPVYSINFTFHRTP